MTADETKVVRANETVAALREMVEAMRDAGREPSAEVMGRLSRAKDRACDVYRAYSAAWEGSFGPAALRMECDRITGKQMVRVVQGNAMGGGRAYSIMEGEAGYDAAVAKIKADRLTDAAVAEIAFAHWGWTGAVRIDYYGATAVVNRGGSKVYVDLPTMSVTKSL